MFRLLQRDSHQLKLYISFFEIYGGRCYDLLNRKKKLAIREDARQQVQIPGKYFFFGEKGFFC